MREKNSPLESIVYVSCAKPPLTRQTLTDLLQHARSKNALEGITGVLLYWDGDIMQALQGPTAHVNGCFERIRADTRHGDVMLLLRETIDQPDFAHWPMGFGPSLARADRDACPGDSLNEPSATRANLPSAGSSARVLLESFHAQRWAG